MAAKRLCTGWFVAAVLLAACAPSAPGTGSQGGSAPSPGEVRGKTLIVVTRNEPSILSRKFPATGSHAQAPDVAGLFEASFFRFDERRNSLPYLVEAVPQLHSETWRVLPDGRMETTYLLRPGLTWHDGTPLSGEDWVFAWQVYSTPELGFRPLPQNLMQEVLAPDPRAVLIRWKQPFPDADSLSISDFPALPRHLLESSFRTMGPDAFLSLPFWSTQWVGLGPYKLERWEPGAFLEGVAFDGHALGRPKIDRIRAVFQSDANTVVANLLAGAGHITFDAAIFFQQGALLRREWAASHGGSVIMTATEVRFMHVQHRLDVANPAAIRDARVRRALAHAVDKQALNDGLLDGLGRPADTLLPLELYTPTIEAAITKYPYDLRRMEQLLSQVGIARGPDGWYVGVSGGRFSPEVRTISGKQEEQEFAILVDGFRRAGVDAGSYIVPTAQSADGQVLASFPALFTGKSNLNDNDGGLDKLLSDKVPRPENRWRGSALGGYTNPEFDRLYDLYTTSLERSARDRALLQMSTMVGEEVSAIPMYYNFEVSAHVAGLAGPREGLTPAGYIHEWEWRS